MVCVSRTWWIAYDSGRGECGGDPRIEFSGRAARPGAEPEGRLSTTPIGLAVDSGGSLSEGESGYVGDWRGLGSLREGVVLLCRRGEEGRRPRLGVGGVVVALALCGGSMGLGYCAKSLLRTGGVVTRLTCDERD